MKELMWLQKHRQTIFALNILLSIVFGPPLASLLKGGWLFLFMTLGVFIILELTVILFSYLFASQAKAKTKKVYEKTQAAHSKIKKDYQELSGQPLKKALVTSTKKKRKPKGKKTHRI
jgi:uncharacterized membrane protein